MAPITFFVLRLCANALIVDPIYLHGTAPAGVWRAESPHHKVMQPEREMSNKVVTRIFLNIFICYIQV
ncbi:hypothetical protein ACO0LM_23235 [Undibacterium sp. Di26W]|uniref:hypothetical protein n=1 Tax=Undibacterium sp. Di26W TaxID=3413035 RepID=UPI003BF01ABB